MKLSSDAVQFMEFLAAEYVKAGFPPHQTWRFEGDVPVKPVHNELKAAGLIKMIGLTGFGYVLTDAGQRWIMENRPDLDG